MNVLDIICSIFLVLNIGYFIYLWTFDEHLDNSTKSALSIGLIGASLALLP